MAATRAECEVEMKVVLVAVTFASLLPTAEAAGQTGRAAGQLLDASKDLAAQAEIMRNEVERYISGVKAA